MRNRLPIARHILAADVASARRTYSTNPICTKTTCAVDHEVTGGNSKGLAPAVRRCDDCVLAYSEKADERQLGSSPQM